MLWALPVIHFKGWLGTKTDTDWGANSESVSGARRGTARIPIGDLRVRRLTIDKSKGVLQIPRGICNIEGA
jgi:hypothetical protein